ncbi:hypothetical protein DI09_7p390 [Mitosporidium daphniae]|uniref:SH3 domain-containing protein n=1 Tax=Mitosporidium daphniae TaxID=1485682 RepID=A0A098VMR8_9MICR|nr:uncharacterized protein DI09_7p390 [Mitosporidium daphniae]KGG50260.1 hypothetical protein DI09_7p390 [Mitosporidium daphniae]|eukprot:XP_013236687.1 uncharacterized protein DI09_7p390 [Mitosporidium daphniae]
MSDNVTGFVPFNYLDVYKEFPILETGIGKIAESFLLVKAMYSYSPVEADELSFLIGDQIQVLEKFDDGWWLGNSLASFHRSLQRLSGRVSLKLCGIIILD